MLRSRVEFAAVGVAAVLGMLFLSPGPAAAADYTVKRDGSGNFLTIQACADAAAAGDSCVVYPGVYNEHVTTTAGGTGEANRIIFRAQGLVTMQGFDIRHPYVTVQGFDITGYPLRYSGLIGVYSGGNSCQILNNTVRDGAEDVAGIYFSPTRGQVASNCVVRGNKLSNLRSGFLATNGDNHLFENNVFEFQNSMDYIRLFGANHVFRRNVFSRGNAVAGAGNHPDFAQTFGTDAFKSENHLFEENWIEDLESQFSQLNSGEGGVSKGILYTNVKNITFRRNVIINVQNNANIVMPGVRFENNTFYRLAYASSGMGFGGSLTRGEASRGLVQNNVFLAGGARATTPGDGAGFYAASGAVLSREVIGVFVTNDAPAQTATTHGIYDDLKNNGYIGANGNILPKAAALKDISQFVLHEQYQSYKEALYDRLIQTVRLDENLRSTFVADYNYVGGAASAGFPAKRTRDCDPQKTYTEGNFCEPHGINGGDPQFANLANPRGADGIPFTLDDGLKPLPTSPLCGRGAGATDIGAYSCDPQKVFPTSASIRQPTNLRITR